MKTQRDIALGLLFVTAIWFPLGPDPCAVAGLAPEVASSQNARRIPKYEVFEILFEHAHTYEHPFFDVGIEVTFVSPSKKEVRVGGFYYGPVEQTDGHRWKARFAPAELGRWKYTYTFKPQGGQAATGEGEFTCIAGRRPNKGFVRVHPTNPFRFVFDDGSAYFPIGLQDCWGDNSKTGTVLDQCSMEGPFRTDRENLPELPDGPLFVRGPSTNPQNADVYFRSFSQCGFDLYRFSQKNCSYSLYEDLDHYLVRESIMTDELLVYARKYGLRMMYGLFGFQKAFNNEYEDAEAMSKVKRFIRYSVDRWGAYVDFWELLNEQHAHDKWYETMIECIRSRDPYRHPITTSWERPELSGIEINAPHWYQRENELESDKITASRADSWKRYDKPVIVGEQGNHIDRNKPQPPGVGGVWDQGSALRMRIRNWTALFEEIAIIFWNTSYARDGHFMNIWLGPLERQYVRAMQDFAYCLDRDVRIAPVEVSDPQSVRAYGLTSQRNAGYYLHHFANHTEPIKELQLTLRVPRSARGYWYKPEDGSIIKRIRLAAGSSTIEVPEFTVDLALLVTRGGLPDADGDGRANHLDPDDDNDGVLDPRDAFPLDPSEWADQDGDWIGDNMDADDDGDGKGDDANGNGIADCEELDIDADGVNRAKTVPWDAFPLDAKEWRDTDGDGIGDNADEDDDNDGFNDQDEVRAGTDPLDKLSFPDDG